MTQAYEYFEYNAYNELVKVTVTPSGAVVKEVMTGSAPDIAPAPVLRITVGAFKRRMTQAERIAIRAAAAGNPIVYDFVDLLDSSSYADLSDPLLIAGLQQMETAGLLGAGRADEILTAPIDPSELP